VSHGDESEKNSHPTGLYFKLTIRQMCKSCYLTGECKVIDYS